MTVVTIAMYMHQSLQNITGHVSEKTKAKAASAKRKYLHYMTYQLDAKLECLL